MFRKFLIILFAIGSAILFCVNVNVNVNAAAKKTSVTEDGTTGKLIEPCRKMFTMTDTLIRDAERQPGTHTQVAKLKSKLSMTKQQIAKMESELQQKSCDKGVVTLNSLKQKH